MFKWLGLLTLFDPSGEKFDFPQTIRSSLMNRKIDLLRVLKSSYIG